MRILEIGGGTGGMTSFVLPVLPEHCTEYMFTDVSPHFIAHAQHKFARFAFLQSRTLDIERNPLEQGFDPHSFDVIIASDVLHATSDLRQTLERIKQLLGSGGHSGDRGTDASLAVHDLDLWTAQGLVGFRRRCPSGRALCFSGRMEGLAARRRLRRHPLRRRLPDA